MGSESGPFARLYGRLGGIQVLADRQAGVPLLAGPTGDCVSAPGELPSASAPLTSVPMLLTESSEDESGTRG